MFLELKTDLLEKSRAIRQAVDERSFHIFYEMLNCASADAKSMHDILICRLVYGIGLLACASCIHCVCCI